MVTKVKRDNETGESEVFEDRMQVDQVIASYFEEIYKRPEHMQQHLEDSMAHNEEMADEQVDTTATFSIDDIRQAT